MAAIHDMKQQRKQQILDVTAEYIKANGGSPTIREINHLIGYQENTYGWTNTLIQELIEEGFMKRFADGGRTLVLVQPAPRPVYYKREEMPAPA